MDSVKERYAETKKAMKALVPSKRVIIAPKPKILLSMRSTGYDNYSAIADIVDNSLDTEVDSSHIKIYISKDINSIVIADDGCGMSKDRLIDALSMGSDGEGEIKTEDLGKYGCGLKTAFSSMARKMTVITKTKKDCFKAIYDIDEIQKTNFEIPMDKSTKEDFDLFRSYTKSATGTVIIIEKIDNLQIHSLEKFAQGLMKHLSEIYRHIIGENKKITVFIGKTPYNVMPYDPMFPNESVLWNKGKENISVKYVNNQGVEKEINLTIKLYILPYHHRSNNIKDQGFYIIRNNRQIERAVDLGMYNKHSIKNRFRAELHFNSINDDDFNLNIQKNSVRIPMDLSETISKKINLEEVLTKIVSEMGKGKIKESEKSGEVELKMEVKTGRNKYEEKVVKATEFVIKAKRVPKKKEKTYPFDFVFEEGRSDKDTIYRMGVNGKGRIKIHMNINHAFCKTFISMTETQQYSLCMLLISFDKALDKLKTELNEDLFFDFYENVSTETTKMIM